MPILAIMGKSFGNLGVRVRHIVTYGISPYEQKIFRGFFSTQPANLVRRFFDQVKFVAPGLLIPFLVCYYAEKEHDRRIRKNPADYINDE